MLKFFPATRHLSGLLRPLLLIALRGLNTAAKFALALYTARFLGLSELGIYGLIVAVVTMLPAFAGLGTMDWLVRQVAGLPTAKAAPMMVTRLAMVLAFHLVFQPIAISLNLAFDAPVPWSLVALLSLISVADHLASDVGELLTFRGRALLSNILLFVRAGLWPIAVIGWGLFDPAARTLECLLIGWLAGLILMWAIFLAFVAQRGRWRFIKFDWSTMKTGVRRSVPFYIKDISIAVNLYLDRFLVSLFLGLELTGVYTFFWSIANVIHTLALFGTFQPHVAKLLEAGRGRLQDFYALLKRVGIETGGFAVVMAAGLALLVPYLLPYLDRPLLSSHIAVFGLVIVATLLKLAGDCYNYVLLAFHQDRAIVMIALAAIPLSALLNALMLPHWGLAGAATAYLLTSAMLLGARLFVGRSLAAVMA